MLKKDNAWLWIPTLYFASGLPYHAITSISDIMYKDMGISNAIYADLALPVNNGAFFRKMIQPEVKYFNMTGKED